MALLGLGMTMSPTLSGCNMLENTLPFLKKPIKVPPWTGDFVDAQDRLQNSKTFPIPNPSDTFDVVVIGGGISGLTAAYQLRDENVLLLERDSELGGIAKQGHYKGIPYSLGSAYLVDTQEPFGSFYNELGLTLTPVERPVNTLRTQKEWTTFAKGPFAKPFEQLRAQLKKYVQQPDFPVLPIENASSAALKLDQISFYDYLKADYPLDFIHCIDAYCRSSLGGMIHEVSAYAGINFYSEIATPIYAFPGGNAYLVQRLINLLNVAGTNRYRTGISVYNIQQNGDQVLTSYYKNSDPFSFQTVASKSVILAIPYFTALQILNGLSPEQQALMFGMQYGAYLVANCCFDREVFQGGYDNWLSSNPAFTHFIAPPSPKQNTSLEKKKAYYPSVLTVYAPFRNSNAGRATLQTTPPPNLAEKLEKELHDVIQYPNGSLQEVRLTRYGHQVLSSKTGLIQKLSKMPKTVGRIILAHSDGQGMASVESAIFEGLYGAYLSKPFLASTSLSNPLQFI